MAQISIRERFHPFSHTPGIQVLLPGTSLCLQVYPTSLMYWDLEKSEEKKSIDLPVVGPITQFTVVQDLEQGAILIFGWDQKGFFRFRCSREFELKQEKGGDFSFALPRSAQVFPAPNPSERLSIVSLQKRTIERLFEAGDWLQLLAPLYRLLVWYDPLPGSLDQPIANYLLGGFEGLFVPTGKDTKKMGYHFSSESPIAFLRALRSKITSFFVEKEGEHLLLCPHIPHEIPAGRIKGLKVGDDTLDLEWRKGILRRVAILPAKDHSLTLHSKGLMSARIGRTVIRLANPLVLKESQILFLDRFEKA